MAAALAAALVSAAPAQAYKSTSIAQPGYESSSLAMKVKGKPRAGRLVTLQVNGSNLLFPVPRTRTSPTASRLTTRSTSTCRIARPSRAAKRPSTSRPTASSICRTRSTRSASSSTRARPDRFGRPSGSAADRAGSSCSAPTPATPPPTTSSGRRSSTTCGRSVGRAEGRLVRLTRPRTAAALPTRRPAPRTPRGGGASPGCPPPAGGSARWRSRPGPRSAPGPSRRAGRCPGPARPGSRT